MVPPSFPHAGTRVVVNVPHGAPASAFRPPREEDWGDVREWELRKTTGWGVSDDSSGATATGRHARITLEVTTGTVSVFSRCFIERSPGQVFA
jgi:hypothetical protein